MIRKIIIACVWICGSMLYAQDTTELVEINEYQSDIYYGNGIMTTKDEAINAFVSFHQSSGVTHSRV